MLPYAELRAVLASPHPTARIDLSRLAAAVKSEKAVASSDLAPVLGRLVVGPTVDTRVVRELGWDLAQLPAAALDRVAVLIAALSACPEESVAVRTSLRAIREALGRIFDAEVPWSTVVDATLLQAARESGRHGGELRKDSAPEDLVRRLGLACGLAILHEDFADARSRLAAVDPEAAALEALRARIAASVKKTLGTP